MNRRLHVCLTTLILAAWCAPAAPPAAPPAKPAAEAFAGLRLGSDTLKEIEKRVTRREELVGPGKATVEPEENLRAQTYRYTGSFDRDRYVTSTMLYFSSKGELAGYDLFLKGRSTYERYGRELARQFTKTAEDRYEGELADGAFKGAKVTATLTAIGGGKSGYKSYQVEVRCLDILRQDKAASGAGD
ncbi:MAG: hypothetical protein BWZ02_03084 [Lentisphaerae bacterium ADurb.BinA184]|nr:MAG: hypothetical protein BWZ02_03084 [Lentisphaerae bacterium ADurb.BinA184]